MDGKERYLCVSFNFEGLGRSGNFQNVRGGYLLSISPAKGSQRLFFGTENTKAYSTSKNNVTIQHFFRKKAQKTLDMVFRDFLWIHAPVAALH